MLEEGFDQAIVAGARQTGGLRLKVSTTPLNGKLELDELIQRQPLAGDLDIRQFLREMQHVNRVCAGRQIRKRQLRVRLNHVILETRGLGCRESGVRNVSLQVRAGEILGIVGLVGAGRTELARTLFGLAPADAGQILIRGHSFAIISPAVAMQHGIAYVPEDRRRHGVILDLSVAQNTSLAVLNELASGGMLSFQREQQLATSYVAQLQIKTASNDTPVGHLSGGNQQKVALSRWLATKPAVLILDEPTQGIDVGAKAEIHRLMGDLAAQGMAIVMISSEMPEVLGMSDRIAVMRGGQIVGEFSRSSATQEAILTMALGSPAAQVSPEITSSAPQPTH